MSTDTKAQFYNQNGQIDNQDTAHTIADTWADKGVNAGVAQENMLKAEHETGLTELQRKNISVIEGLNQKYPHAFATMISSSGETIVYPNLPIRNINESDTVRSYTDPEEMRMLVAEGKNHGYAYGGYDPADFAFTKNGVLVHPEKDIHSTWANYIEKSADVVENRINLTPTSDNNDINKNGLVAKNITELDANKKHSLKVYLTIAENYNKKKLEEQVITPTKDIDDFLNAF